MIDESKGLTQLKIDAKKIEQILSAQFNTLCLAQCPIVEEIIDTQMFGFVREVEFAKSVGLIEASTGRLLIADLEGNVNQLYNEIFEEQAKVTKEHK